MSQGSMPRFSIRNPYFIIVLCLALLVIGVTSIARMPVDLFPTINLPEVVVATFYSACRRATLKLILQTLSSASLLSPAASITWSPDRCSVSASLRCTFSRARTPTPTSPPVQPCAGGPEAPAARHAAACCPQV